MFKIRGIIKSLKDYIWENFFENLAFSGDRILAKNVSKLIKEKKITTIIETGTFNGDTTKFLANLTKNIYTIELNEKFYNLTKSRKDIPSNIEFFLGNSPEIIDRQIFPKIKKDSVVLFFLDAHWESPCPTLLELKVIAKNKIKPFILIHDFQVPNHPELGFDKYTDFIYTFEKIKSILEEIYGENGYIYQYNTRASGSKRGVIIIYSLKEKVKTKF
jgi:hypothetical protein